MRNSTRVRHALMLPGDADTCHSGFTFQQTVVYLSANSVLCLSAIRVKSRNPVCCSIQGRILELDVRKEAEERDEGSPHVDAAGRC